MKLADIKSVTEGFFKNEIIMKPSDVEKLSGKFKHDWVKSGNVWTMHDGEDHLFTYNVKREILMTDKNKVDVV